MFVYYLTIWSILGYLVYIVCGHLAYFWLFGIFFPHFGMLRQEKSGNPAEVNACYLATLIRAAQSTYLEEGWA
jgi:hypothetical protein